MKQNSKPKQPIAEIYEEWEASGQTIAEFSRKKSINPDRLYYRRTYLAGKRKQSSHKTDKSATTGRFIQVTPPVVPHIQSITVSVGKVNIAYDVDTDDQLFLKLVNLLKVPT
jgi:hypothetical protein